MALKNIERIFTVFGIFLLICKFGIMGLSLNKQIYTKFNYSLKIYLNLFGKSCSKS